MPGLSPNLGLCDFFQVFLVWKLAASSWRISRGRSSLINSTIPSRMAAIFSRSRDHGAPADMVPRT
ncbi:MAG: hypothetical protein ABSE66_03235 [Thermoplasmata archaeon]